MSVQLLRDSSCHTGCCRTVNRYDRTEQENVTMTEPDWLADRFEAHRTHLRAVAYRMLGSVNEADDAVQEAWIRLSRTDSDELENLGGWLTTVVARICLNMLQARKVRRDEPVGGQLPDSLAADDSVDPEHQAVLADSVGVAMLVVLDTLAPAERLAFVLHDMFGVPFDDIATILGKSPAAARQLASRARRRVRGGEAPEDADQSRRQQVVDAFLAASREGDFESLIALLDPDAVCRADAVTVRVGAVAEVRGAAAVAATFAGRAQAAEPALIDGAPGLVWSQAGTPRVVFAFTINDDGHVTAIDLLGDPTRLTELDIELLDG